MPLRHSLIAFTSGVMHPVRFEGVARHLLQPYNLEASQSSLSMPRATAIIMSRMMSGICNVVHTCGGVRYLHPLQQTLARQKRPEGHLQTGIATLHTTWQPVTRSFEVRGSCCHEIVGGQPRM